MLVTRDCDIVRVRSSAEGILTSDNNNTHFNNKACGQFKAIHL
jgi:hypothetical protein